MSRADGTGEGLLMTAVVLAGVVLAFCATPGMWWLATITAREHDANRTRVVVAAIIAAVTWIPAAALLIALRCSVLAVGVGTSTAAVGRPSSHVPRVFDQTGACIRSPAWRSVRRAPRQCRVFTNINCGANT
jgi:hypothetical protein